jgi:hypothetical protein
MTEEVVIVETPRGDPVNNVEPGEPDGPEVGFEEIIPSKGTTPSVNDPSTRAP